MTLGGLAHSRARAVLFDRTEVGLESLVLQLQISLIRESNAKASGARGIDTVKHVDAKRDTDEQVDGVPDLKARQVVAVSFQSVFQ
jgi:hypothetical protein